MGTLSPTRTRAFSTSFLLCCSCAEGRKDRKGRGKKMKMRWRFQTRREIHRSNQTYATRCEITELCTCSLGRSVSRPAFMQTSAPVPPFSRLGLPRLVFRSRMGEKKKRIRARVHTRETETNGVISNSRSITKDEFHSVPLLDIFYALFGSFSKEVRIFFAFS